MTMPLIGLTCQLFPEPIVRSSVNQQYIDAVAAAGGAPILIPLNIGSPALESVYSILDGLLLPGGDDVSPERYGEQAHPMLGDVSEARDSLEFEIVSRALRDNLPILGICRGAQVLAVAAGGSLWQDVPTQYESALPHDVQEHGRDHLCHEITVMPDSILQRSIGRKIAVVNSFHHQAVRRVPPDFWVTASAGDGVVEAIESREHRFVLGLQCHPEGMWRTTASEFAGVFQAFIEAARTGTHAVARQATG